MSFEGGFSAQIVFGAGGQDYQAVGPLAGGERVRRVWVQVESVAGGVVTFAAALCHGSEASQGALGAGRPLIVVGGQLLGRCPAVVWTVPVGGVREAWLFPRWREATGASWVVFGAVGAMGVDGRVLVSLEVVRGGEERVVASAGGGPGG
jgi:hypothetical protein